MDDFDQYLSKTYFIPLCNKFHLKNGHKSARQSYLFFTFSLNFDRCNEFRNLARDPGNVKIFNDTDEFTEYYRSHEEEFKNVSTLILNRNYKIPGYRITVSKRGTDQEELQLKKDYYSRNDKTEDLDKILEQIKFLTERIDNIEQFLSEIK